MEKYTNKQDQISYMELVRFVLLRKAVIGYTVLTFLVVAIVIVITSPVEYESSAVTISEFKEEGLGGLGQLGSLAGLAGVSLPSSNAPTFSPSIYPDVIHSRAFLLDIIQEEFYFETKGKKMSLKDYYLDERPGNFLVKTFKFFTGLPSRLISSISGSKVEIAADAGLDPMEDDMLKITAGDEFAIAELRKRISIENNKQLFTIRVKSPEPLISAHLNNIVLGRLITYVSDYLTEKQRINLEFVEQRTKEAEQKFIDSQLALASFRDANQGIVSQRARTREEFLQSQFNIAFNLYNTLKQQQEQSFIQLKKETPVFTTIEPPMVPLGKAEPRSALIIIVSLFLGLFVGVAIIVGLILVDFYKGTFNRLG